MSASASKPFSRSISAGIVTGSLHASHRARASRCATTQVIDDATRNGSMPISTSRVTALAASFVWSVERMRWPVSDDSIAVVGRLAVADLADHDHVGVRAHHRAQPGGEVEARLRG